LAEERCAAGSIPDLMARGGHHIDGSAADGSA
jgi:hypothetical protein